MILEVFIREFTKTGFGGPGPSIVTALRELPLEDLRYLESLIKAEKAQKKAKRGR